jgi:uncharacterized Zn-binding protein involved in type VI secretion
VGAPDDKANAVAAGLPSVLVGGKPVARPTDLVAPAQKPITEGSATVMAGGLPVARMTSATAVPSKLIPADARVFVGGDSVVIPPPPPLPSAPAAGPAATGGAAVGGAAAAGGAGATSAGKPPAITTVQRGNTTITVDRDTKTITLTGTQEYSGSGATQDYADRATASINQTWSGTTTFEGESYQVNSRITGQFRAAGDPATATATQVDVVQTTDPPSVTTQSTHPSNQPFYGTSPGHQHSTDLDGGVHVVPHEFGHSMGLPDEYHDDPRNPDGTRNVVRTGPVGGLMGYSDSTSHPTPDNFNSLITGNGLAK